jgi:hypothetical protein
MGVKGGGGEGTCATSICTVVWESRFTTTPIPGPLIQFWSSAYVYMIDLLLLLIHLNSASFTRTLFQDSAVLGAMGELVAMANA